MREDWQVEQEEERGIGGGEGALLSELVPCLDEETLRDVFFDEQLEDEQQQHYHQAAGKIAMGVK